MDIIYKRLFNLTLGHDYFADGFDRFIQLAPTVETILLLRNGKMLLKKLPHGITVLFQAAGDETTPLVQLSGNQKFIFALTAENKAGFCAVTDLDESSVRKFESGKILLFKNNSAAASVNLNDPEIITHEIIDSVRTGLFTFTFYISGNPSSVKIKVADAEGNLISVGRETDGTPFPTTVTIYKSANDTYFQSIDLRNKSKGKYTISIIDNSETTELKTEIIYVDEILASQNIIGITEIVYTSGTGNLYGETEEYRIQFSKAETFWKYYIVNKSSNIDFSTESLQIHDSGTVNGTPYVINQFERVYAAIKLTADTPGSAGNSITLEYSGAGNYPGVQLSGETFSGGATAIKATASLTVINNSVTGYTIAIGSVSFTEGTDFSKGGTAEATAAAIITAINANAAFGVTAEMLPYDVLINNKQTLVLSSDQEVPFFEKPKLNIELQKTSDDQVIIAHLPNPSKNGLQKIFGDRKESELYVFI